MDQGIFVRDQETAWSPFAANSGDSGRDISGDRPGRIIRRHRGEGLGWALSPSQPQSHKLHFRQLPQHMRKIMSDPEIVMSSLCREISKDGTKIQIDIYRGEDDSGWILEVIDEENASTVWDDPFNSDQEALDAVMEVIEKDGIRSFLESDSGVTH
jgi:uncharacterized protein